MIDAHNHILPGVDDGVKRVKDSLTILKAYEAMGIKAVVLTPHYAPKRGYYKSQSELNTIFLKLKEAAKNASIDVALFLGSEIDYSPTIIDDIRLAPSMNDSNIYLIDFGVGDPDIEEVIYELSIRDCKVIVAHPERYRNITLTQWKKIRQLGGVLQVSAKHLVKGGNKTSQKWAKTFLKEDMIDLIASDLHSQKDVQSMEKAYKYVMKKKPNQAEMLFNIAPKKVIYGAL